MANLSISPKKMHIPPFIKKVAIGVPTYDHCCVFSHSPLFFNPHSSKEAQFLVLMPANSLDFKVPVYLAHALHLCAVRRVLASKYERNLQPTAAIMYLRHRIYFIVSL